MERDTLRPATPLLGQRHGLHLDSVDPRKATDAVLFQRDGIAPFGADPVLLLDFGEPREQLIAEELGIDRKVSAPAAPAP
ncbi:MAG: hypothetical protein OHK0018_06260 [Erythrobacter tepidarius]